MIRKASEQDSGDLPLFSKRGLFLPSWSVVVAATALIGVVTLAVESRAELAHQQASITELKIRIERLEERNAKAIETIRDALGRLQLSMARVCHELKADCPQ